MNYAGERAHLLYDKPRGDVDVLAPVANKDRSAFLTGQVRALDEGWPVTLWAWTGTSALRTARN
jgi:hypothetical protein